MRERFIFLFLLFGFEMSGSPDIFDFPMGQARSPCSDGLAGLLPLLTVRYRHVLRIQMLGEDCPPVLNARKVERSDLKFWTLGIDVHIAHIVLYLFVLRLK